MRTVLFFLACCVSTVAAAAGSDGANGSPAGVAVKCESQSPGGDVREFACPLEGSTAPRRYRVKADFSGGHDDTIASMTPTLDGAPLACDPGSKTSLMGEDGDVSLECSFSTAGRPGATAVLKVRLKWSHAQYTDFVLHRE